jgi:hypothetical protein
MAKTGIALLLAAAILAGCGSSTKGSKSSLITATVPGGAAVTLPGSGSATSTAPTLPSTGSVVTPTTGGSTTTTAPPVSVPRTGALTSTQFKAAANQICEQIDGEARSLGTAGETANPSAATKLTKLEKYSEQAVAKLSALESRGPAAAQKEDRDFLVFVKDEDVIGSRAASDAETGNQAGYTGQLEKLSVLSGDETAAGSALAPACAQG